MKAKTNRKVRKKLKSDDLKFLEKLQKDMDKKYKEFLPKENLDSKK